MMTGQHVMTALLGAAAMVAPALAHAQTPAPAPTSAAPVVQGTDRPFQAWNLHCETRTDPAPRVRICGLMSTVTLQDEKGARNVALQFMLRSVPGAKGWQLSVDTPIGVWLPDGVQLVRQGKELVRLPFVACQPKGCQAGVVLTPAQFAAFVTATDQADAVYRLQTRQTVTLTFSMLGFADGAAALAKSAD